MLRDLTLKRVQIEVRRGECSVTQCGIRRGRNEMLGQKDGTDFAGGGETEALAVPGNSLR